MRLIRAQRGLARLRRLADLPRTTPSRRKPTIVSLTFDDAVETQRIAADLLARHGLRASFYVPSGLVGEGGYLTWDDLSMFAERGHEIGGHTASHVRLPDVALDEARREIVTDRHTLIERGLNPMTFSYPYGKQSAEVEGLVREAGYVAARGIGGMVETVPPADPYRLRAPHSARTWTTAEHLAGLVLSAEHEQAWMEPEQAWLILSFHHIRNDLYHSFATPTAELDAFLGWLVERGMSVLPVREAFSPTYRRSLSNRVPADATCLPVTEGGRAPTPWHKGAEFS
jgi:peptidoglycan/xylan/chitin deacetylase (PgdA/CDA1 family)